MHSEFNLIAAANHLSSTAALLANGKSERAINAAVRSGELVRLRYGWYIDGELWQQLSKTQQHMLLAVAVNHSARSEKVFSHQTAATLLGLPLLEFNSSRVHTLEAKSKPQHSSDLIARHIQDYDESEVQRSYSLLHTNTARTTIDLMRTSTFAQGVIIGDAVLHHAFVKGGHESAEHFRYNLLQKLDSMPGTRGKNRAKRVIMFLNQGAESPLESLYRLQFERLGFEVKTQIPVPSPNGGNYRMDMELVGYNIFFEADGRVKYSDKTLRHGKSLEDIIIAERDREAWIRSRVSHRVLRGGWRHAQSPEATAALLREYGVTPPLDVTRKPLLHLY